MAVCHVQVVVVGANAAEAATVAASRVIVSTFLTTVRIPRWGLAFPALGAVLRRLVTANPILRPNEPVTWATPTAVTDILIDTPLSVSLPPNLVTGAWLVGGVDTVALPLPAVLVAATGRIRLWTAL